MVHNLVRKGGVPVWAYPPTDASISWPCSLTLLHSATDAQFTVLLEASIFIHGVDHGQHFILRFDGDNIVPGKISLEHFNITPSDESVGRITREGVPKLAMLSLTLKAPCCVWYPLALGKVFPFYTPSYELVALAKTTQICILFDTAWLGGNYSKLQSISRRSSQLFSVPVPPHTIYARSHLKADWSILIYSKDAEHEGLPLTEGAAPDVVPSVEDAVSGVPPTGYAADDAPPPYVSSKRPRDTRTSLTPDSPFPKRRFQDPTCPPLQTERATSTSSSTATVQSDVLQDIVTSIIKKVLPGMLQEQLSSDLQETLLDVFGGPSPSPSLSPTPPSCQIATALAQHRSTSSHKLTPPAPLKATIRTCIKTSTQRLYTKAINQAHDQAYDIYNSAGAELAEDVNDYKADVATITEDYVVDLNRKRDEMLVEIKERIDEAIEEVEEHVEKVASKVGAKCRCQCLHGAEYKQSKLEQGRRATSLPVC